MAISSTNYVGASVISNAQSAGFVTSNLTGLVITGASMGETSDGALLALKTKFENYEPVSLTAGEVEALFGTNSPEKNFAVGYYGYMSPNGMFPTSLYFLKYDPTDTGSGHTGLVSAAEKAFGANVDFGSFTFLSLPRGSTDSDEDDVIAVAALNSGRENRKLYVVNFKKTDGSSSEIEDLKTVADSLASAKGCCLVYGATDWSAFMPMAIMASQNILTTGLVQFMFNRFTPPTSDDIPTVTDDSTYSTLSSHNVNFLGRSQMNGQNLDFFQRGYATNGEDLTQLIATNWIEAQTRDGLMNLFLTQVMPATNSSVIAVEDSLSKVMTVVRDAGVLSTMESISEESHKTIVDEIIYKLGGTLDDVNTVELGLTTKSYGIVVKLNPKKNLGAISGGHIEPSISYKVIFAYAGAVRFISGNHKVISQ